MKTTQNFRQRLGAIALTAGLLVGGGIILGPVSPASAASCTARSQGGVNSSGANWVTGQSHLCAGNVQARAIRTVPGGDFTFFYGPVATSSTATTNTVGTRAAGGFTSYAASPSKYATEPNYDATWRNRTFTW